MSKLGKSVRVCFDLFILAVLIFITYVIAKWWEPIQQGFFCNDESLQYPYREQTIGVVMLLVIVFPVPCLIIITVQLFRRMPPLAIENRHHNKAAQKMPPAGIGCRLSHRFAQCYHHLIYYIFGLGLTLIATEITKHSCGRLRPHFQMVCQPQFPDGTSCEDSNNHVRYITEFTCSNQNFTDQNFKETHLSFPSGHTSLSFFAMCYIAFYVHSVMLTRISKLLKHLLQFACITVAWYVALTRVSDYWHHWSDVIVGGALGVLMAYVISRYVAELSRHLPRTGRFGDNSKFSTSSSLASGGKSSTVVAEPTPTAVLPAYTFGTMPYLHYAPPPPPASHHKYAAAQTYHNYGYVP